MKQTFILLLTFTLLFSIGCGSRSSDNNTTAANTPAVAKTPADGFYQGKGVVTKINNELGSVEIDHENIPDLMPPMKMEFSVKDKAMLKPIAVGDTVAFTMEHKQGSNIIIAIGK